MVINRRRGSVLGAFAGALLVAGCGSSHDSAHGSSSAASTDVAPVVVEVTMTDFAFSPSTLEVPHGVPVQIKVTNDGSMAHELVIGDQDAQDKAEAEMRSSDMDMSGTGAMDDEHGHDTPFISLEAGTSGVIETTFDDAGELLIGCHVAGHWKSGMRGTLTIT